MQKTSNDDDNNDESGDNIIKHKQEHLISAHESFAR